MLGKLSQLKTTYIVQAHTQESQTQVNLNYVAERKGWNLGPQGVGQNVWRKTGHKRNKDERSRNTAT